MIRLEFKVTVEFIEPEEAVKSMDISDSGLAKSKMESLNKVAKWCEDELWGWRVDKLLSVTREFGMIPYTNLRH